MGVPWFTTCRKRGGCSTVVNLAKLFMTSQHALVRMGGSRVEPRVGMCFWDRDIESCRDCLLTPF